MAEDNKTLQLFTTRMRKMILQYKDVKKENEELYAMVDARDQEVKQLKSQLEQAQNDYNSLKMAKMVEITDGDLESAKKRLSGLIRDINKSITLLSEQHWWKAMAEDKLHIRLHVYDMDIPANIRREDEFFYREAAKLISNTVNTYADIYKGRKSEKEVLYMAMIDIALRYEKEKGNNDTSAYDDILQRLTSEIEECLWTIEAFLTREY